MKLFPLLFILFCSAKQKDHKATKTQTASLVSVKTVLTDTSQPFKVIRKLIEYNEARKNLSLQYLEERHGLIQKTPVIVPVMIVLHYTAGGTVNSTFNYFNRLQVEENRQYNKTFSKLNVSAHYVVDRDGTVYQLVEDTLFSRHTIGLNYCAIGVENIGGPDQPLTKNQATANANLIKMLAKKYPIQYVIGHSEYVAFRKSGLWKESNPSYITYKQDPGEAFLQQVRLLIADLKMKTKPDQL